MIAVEQTHYVPMSMGEVRRNLGSTTFWEDQMPAGVELDFHDVQGNTLVAGSQFDVSVNVKALREERSAMSPVVAAFLDMARVGSKTTVHVREAEDERLRFGTYKQPLGGICLTHELSVGPKTNITSVRTAIQVARIYRSQNILQQGVDGLLEFLFADVRLLRVGSLTESDAS